jgi:peptidylprolyl isomerase
VCLKKEFLLQFFHQSYRRGAVMWRWMLGGFIFMGTLFAITEEGVEMANQKLDQPIVVFQTNLGTIELTLMPDVAPKACENFISLVKNHYYDGVVFHRVIRGFMVQGGDPTGTGAGGESIWGKTFVDECSSQVRFDKPGLLAMANRGPNTNGSQFFITTVPTPHLNQRHTIFGKVSSGYPIVQKIETVPTARGDRPVDTVRIEKAYLKGPVASDGEASK